MHGFLSPARLEEDGIYLGVLTARRVKALGRLEYQIQPDVLQLLADLGLIIDAVARIAQDGTKVSHLMLTMDPDLLERYKADFDGAVIEGETPATIEKEAFYFGYPACCAAAYIKDPYARSHLSGEEQGLLFHRPCPGCQKTPVLIPLYRSALAEATRLHKKLLADRGPRKGAAPSSDPPRVVESVVEDSEVAS